MVICPWCGTCFLAFQPNCSRCGGPLHPPEVIETAVEIPPPPAAPRPISDSYTFKLMTGDGWSITGLVFLLVGGIFFLVGFALTIAVITAMIGLPFLALGLIFLAACTGILIWRYRESQKQVRVLKWGEATLGRVIDLQQNYHVRVNGRFPWIITYQYDVNGQSFSGNVSTLNQPGSRLQPGRQIYVLFLHDFPALSSLYPHP